MLLLLLAFFLKLGLDSDFALLFSDAVKSELDFVTQLLVFAEHINLLG